MKAFPRDIDVQTVAIRHIGIENELYTGNDGRTVPPGLEDAINKRGLLQGIGWDGGGREFRTTPISLKSLRQVRGHKYLTEYYEHIKFNTKVVDSGGTHIHISILNKDHKNMESNATALGIAFFKQFQKIAGRKTHWAGIDYGKSIQEVRDCLEGNRSYRRVYMRSGSMLSPTEHQTLEFRGPKGSNDAGEILAWTEFLENVVKASNRKSVDGVKFGDLLKGERIEKYVGALKGWRKLAQKDMNKTVNVTALA